MFIEQLKNVFWFFIYFVLLSFNIEKSSFQESIHSIILHCRYILSCIQSVFYIMDIHISSHILPKFFNINFQWKILLHNKRLYAPEDALLVLRWKQNEIHIWKIKIYFSVVRLINMNLRFPLKYNWKNSETRKKEIDLKKIPCSWFILVIVLKFCVILLCFRRLDVIDVFGILFLTDDMFGSSIFLHCFVFELSFKTVWSFGNLFRVVTAFFNVFLISMFCFGFWLVGVNESSESSIIFILFFVCLFCFSSELDVSVEP